VRPTAQPALGDIVRALTGLGGALSRWRARRRAAPGWTAVVAAILALVSIPIVTIVVLALRPDDGVEWGNLVANVLPHALADTSMLMLGNGVLTLVLGTATAWLVTMYRFPGRAILDRVLVLPLAVPTYLVAYAYGELFSVAGPLQSAVRALFGFRHAGEYWFPQVASRPGAVMIMSLVLYPYVYLSARASFVQQSAAVLEVARTLGRTPLETFRVVALPLARPALAAGVALVLMETLNDLGAVQYLGVETLTASIYATWLQRQSLVGAARIAGLMLACVALLFALERWSRGNLRVAVSGHKHRSIPFEDIPGWRGGAIAALAALPAVLGFVVPLIVIARHAVTHAGPAIEGGFWRAAGNSLLLSTVAAATTILVALALSYARRVAANGFTRPAARLAGLGYAIPGTVLGLGLMIPLAGLDNAIDAAMRATFGLSTGLLVTGSLAGLTLAYTIRFLAVALGGIDAGLERISPNLDAAARALGRTALGALVEVHVPLLLPALGAAGLLVFVDAMKELPATLLLRPFNFETLATHVYSFAAIEQFEDACLGALAIVLTGLVPVLALHRAVAGRRG
jgi:iron(III) transport system permease protein